MAIVTPVLYLRTPTKLENNTVNEERDSGRWLIYSIALGALSYYAPKTFLVASLGLTIWQVYAFHQDVHSKSTKEIRASALHICVVMSSIGVVLGLQCLPWFRSSFKAARHFQLFRSAGHGLVGMVIASVGLVGLFGPFRNTEKKLSEMREWVQMRDFVLNYPPQIINSIKKTALFISALLPDTFITTGMAIGDLIFNQFRSPQFMLDTLKIFFSNAKLLPSIPLVNSPSCEEWMIAIHQFQSLPIEAQLALGPYLARIAKASKDFQVVQLPKEVKLVLLNEHLKSFAKIPSNEEEQKYSEWILAVKPFNSLNADQQAIFGEQTSRLIRASSPSGPLAGSNELRRAALKQSLKLFVQKPSDAEWTWALRLMQSLPIEMYKDFGTESEVYARNLTSDQTNRLPPLMQFSLLHHTLSSVERVPLNSHMDVRWTYINYLYYYLPENMRPHSDIETQLNRIAKVSEQGLINALPNTELKARLLHLKASCGSVNATEG